MVLLILGVVALIAFPIVAFTEVGWICGILSISLTGGTVFLVHSLVKKAEASKDNIQQVKTARNVTNIIIRVSAVMIVVGAIMFIVAFAGGPTSHVKTFTECGWCGGSGIVTGGKICSLCNGAGGAYGAAARYSATFFNKLGFVIAGAGTVILSGARIIKSDHKEVFPTES